MYIRADRSFWLEQPSSETPSLAHAEPECRRKFWGILGAKNCREFGGKSVRIWRTSWWSQKGGFILGGEAVPSAKTHGQCTGTKSGLRGLSQLGMSASNSESSNNLYAGVGKEGEDLNILQAKLAQCARQRRPLLTNYPNPTTGNLVQPCRFVLTTKQPSRAPWPQEGDSTGEGIVEEGVGF